LSYTINLNQDFYYDTRTLVKPKGGFTGGFLNFSTGITMSIGSHKHHADWYTFPALVDKDLEKINLFEIQLEQLEMKLEDFDGDGVSNYMDDEQNTPKGNRVDSRGVSLDKLDAPNEINKIDTLLNPTKVIPSNPNKDLNNRGVEIKEKTVYVDSNKPDSDSDGVPDIYDLFPNVVGTYKGCPDADGDQIPDIIDDCPNIKGIAKFNGCPEKKAEIIKIPEVKTPEIKPELKIFSEVFFEMGISRLSIKSIEELDKLVKYMKEKPTIKLDVIGFADQTGSPTANEKLSKQRAAECVNYMVKKGIDIKRFTITNKTAVNTEGIDPLLFGTKNRKVSFIVRQ